MINYNMHGSSPKHLGTDLQVCIVTMRKYHMSHITPKSLAAGVIAGALAFSAPAASLTTVASAQTYNPTFNAGQYEKNVNNLASQITTEMKKNGKKVSDDTLEKIFDTPFKGGKATVKDGYTPTFGAEATGKSAAEVKAFKKRGLDEAQRLSDDDLNKAINTIFKGEAPVDSKDAVAVPDAAIDPNKPSEEVKDAPPAPAPEPKENTADDAVAAAPADTDTAPVDPPKVEAPKVEQEVDEKDAAEDVEESKTVQQTAPSGQESTGTQTVSEAPRLANTGASVLALLALGGVAAAAGTVVLRRKK